MSFEPITLYTFEDAQGNEFGSFTTQSYADAKAYAESTHTRVIANHFEFSDSELDVDFTL